MEHLRIARDGRILSTGSAVLGSKSGAGSVFFGLDQVTPVLPPDPVEAGATWTTRFEQELSDADQPLRVTATNTLVHYQTVDHHTTAVITSAVSMPFGFSLDGRRALPKGAPGARTTAFAVSGNGAFFQTSWMDPVGAVLPQFSVSLDEGPDLGLGQLKTLVSERRKRLEWIAQKLQAQLFVREQSTDDELYRPLRHDATAKIRFPCQCGTGRAARASAAERCWTPSVPKCPLPRAAAPAAPLRS